MKFSERIGKTPITREIQKEHIDDTLRTQLWSVLTLYVFDKHGDSFGSGSVGGSNMHTFITIMWFKMLKMPVDEIPEYWFQNLRMIKAQFFTWEWFKVYDFLEFVIEHTPFGNSQDITKMLNKQLEAEFSAYRIVDGQVVEITSDAEITSINDALEKSAPYSGVRQHLTRSLQLLSDKENPDYRNSIKESISAVEAMVRAKLNKSNGTLNKLIKDLKLHPCLEMAYTKLYNYTSDADGIRHAMMEGDSVDLASARYMLVVCTAFVNLLIDSNDDQISRG